MASAYIYVLAGILGLVFAFLVYGFIYTLIKRYRREQKGDIYAIPQESRPKGELPVEIRAERDMKYKRVSKDPYENE